MADQRKQLLVQWQQKLARAPVNGDKMCVVNASDRRVVLGSRVNGVARVEGDGSMRLLLRELLLMQPRLRWGERLWPQV